jgi:hypothetical protein
MTDGVLRVQERFMAPLSPGAREELMEGLAGIAGSG